MVTGVTVSALDLRQLHTHFCEVCTLAKHRRSPFQTLLGGSSARLELMHMELCGPFHVFTPEGA